MSTSALQGKKVIGITAGASAPEKLVRDVLSYLSERAPDIEISEIHGEPENMVFALPKELRLTIQH